MYSNFCVYSEYSSNNFMEIFLYILSIFRTYEFSIESIFFFFCIFSMRLIEMFYYISNILLSFISNYHFSTKRIETFFIYFTYIGKFVVIGYRAYMFFFCVYFKHFSIRIFLFVFMYFCEFLYFISSNLPMKLIAIVSYILVFSECFAIVFRILRSHFYFLSFANIPDIIP